MTPAADYKKALEALNKVWVEAELVMDKAYEPYYATIREALQPCAEAMTEDELVDILRLKWNSALGVDRFRDKHDEFRQYIRALVKSGHLKVKA